MSNHPNMSYCMMHNTELALRQIMNHIEDSMYVDEDDEDFEYEHKLSYEETLAFQRILDMAEQLVALREDMDNNEHGFARMLATE